MERDFWVSKEFAEKSAYMVLAAGEQYSVRYREAAGVRYREAAGGQLFPVLLGWSLRAQRGYFQPCGNCLPTSTSKVIPYF